MMILKGGSRSALLRGSWHVGETLRVPTGTRVLSLEVDGHELTALYEALRLYGVKIEVVESQQEMTPIL